MPNVKGEYDFMYEVFMKMNIAAFFACLIALTTLLFTGCQSADKDGGENNQQPTQTVIELDENNYWKYFAVTYDMSNLYPGGKGQFFYDIKVDLRCVKRFPSTSNTSAFDFDKMCVNIGVLAGVVLLLSGIAR